MGNFFSGYPQTQRQMLSYYDQQFDEKHTMAVSVNTSNLGHAIFPIVMPSFAGAADGARQQPNSTAGRPTGRQSRSTLSNSHHDGKQLNSQGQLANSGSRATDCRSPGLLGVSLNSKGSAAEQIEKQHNQTGRLGTTQNTKQQTEKHGTYGARKASAHGRSGGSRINAGDESRRNRPRTSKQESGTAGPGGARKTSANNQYNDGEWMYNLDSLAREYGPAAHSRR